VITGTARVSHEHADGMVYHGHRPSAGGGVITVDTAEGTVLDLLHHHIRHSPTRLVCGYEGSGASETARCLLPAALDAPVYPLRVGHRLTVLSEHGQRRCDSDADNPLDLDVLACTARAPYQELTRQVVAGWSEAWRATRAEVRAWLTSRGVTL
jgi:hypothetical protein